MPSKTRSRPWRKMRRIPLRRPPPPGAPAALRFRRASPAQGDCPRAHWSNDPPWPACRYGSTSDCCPRPATRDETPRLPGRAIGWRPWPWSLRRLTAFPPQLLAIWPVANLGPPGPRPHSVGRWAGVAWSAPVRRFGRAAGWRGAVRSHPTLCVPPARVWGRFTSVG